MKSIEIGNEVLSEIRPSSQNIIDLIMLAEGEGIDGMAKCRAETSPGSEHKNPVENIQDENEASMPFMFQEFYH